MKQGHQLDETCQGLGSKVVVQIPPHGSSDAASLQDTFTSRAMLRAALSALNSLQVNAASQILSSPLLQTRLDTGQQRCPSRLLLAHGSWSKGDVEALQKHARRRRTQGFFLKAARVSERLLGALREGHTERH